MSQISTLSRLAAEEVVTLERWNLRDDQDFEAYFRVESLQI